MLEGHVVEMHRRQDASDEHSSSFAKTGSCTLPLELPGQNVALFSSSHVEMAPRCSDVDEPGIIFYGVFDDVDDAREHVASSELLRSGRVNVQVHPLREWAVLASSAQRLSDADAMQAHVKAVLSTHETLCKSRQSDFNQSREEKQAGDSAPEKPATTNSFGHKDLLRSQNLRKVSTTNLATAPPHGQKFVVVSFVPDHDGKLCKEPLFRVYGVFESEADADSWVRHVLAEVVTDVNIDVVSAGQWIFPQNVSGKDISKEAFRGEELDKIMQQHKNEPCRVKTFEAWQKTQG